MIKVLLYISPVFLFGASVDIFDSDFVERVINFVIFVAILWYLLADKVKAFLSNRKDSISSKLSLAESKLSASILAKEDALKALEQAKNKAEHIVNLASKEAIILSKSIEGQCTNKIESLNKYYRELREFENNKMKQQVVNGVIDELLDSNSIQLVKNNYLDILREKIG